jgi:putative drug exporter of the RND superfamily
MIFQHLGQLVSRGWAFGLAAWILLLALAIWLAPRWSDVAQDREFALLPSQSPTRLADKEFRKAFPEEPLGSNIVLVLHRATDEPGFLERDRAFIEDVIETRLNELKDDERFASTIARVRTPSPPGAEAYMISADRKALLVVIDLTHEFLSSKNWPVLDEIEAYVRELKESGKLPAGVQIAVTGSAAIGRDHNLAQLQSARATELLTVVLVVGLLLLIYQAPLLAGIPLLAVFLSVELSLKILAILGGLGYLDLFEGIEIYVTILAYGAGVDYCLFLISRYKEELDHGTPPAEAVARAIAGVGVALTASAATVICGIAMMYFAQFGKFRQAGIAIPLSLGLVLLATLTFSPCLLRLFGTSIFWPRKARKTAGSETIRPPAMTRYLPRLLQTEGLRTFWESVSGLLRRRSGAVWLVTVGVLAPFAVAGLLLYDRLSYDLIGNLPASAPSVAGTQVLHEHFPGGVLGQVTVLMVQPKYDFSGEAGQELVEQITTQLHRQEDALGIADLRTQTSPLGTTKQADEALKNLNRPIEVVRQKAFNRFVTSLGERDYIGTKLDIVATLSPFAPKSIADLTKIEEAIRSVVPAENRSETRLYFLGATASARDLSNVMREDRSRIELLVLASVFVILILLLRRVVVSIILLVSVLFSYYATLGVAFAVFWLLDPQGFTGIDWKVAIFLFTILIAVGEDYNIFLVARISEEEKEHGPVESVLRALTATGPIISSCGIIMAGTFASLLAASLNEMKQLGFALCFGVLLDTFVVRPILVPASLVVLRRGRHKPGQEKSR